MASRRTYFWAITGLVVICVICVAAAGAYFWATGRLAGGQPPEDDPAAGANGSFSSLIASRSIANPQPETEFSQADAINVFYTLESPGDGPRIVKASLLAVASDEVTPETVLAEAQMTNSTGSSSLQLASSRPWPVGRYRIDMTIDGLSAGSLDIAVVNTNTSGAQLQNVFTSLDQAGEQRTDTFPTAGSVFVHFSLANAPQDTLVQGIMVAEDASGLRSGTQVTQASGRLGDGSYWFEFFNDGPWPVGAYSVYIYLNGQIIQQVPVRIR